MRKLPAALATAGVVTIALAGTAAPAPAASTSSVEVNRGSCGPNGTKGQPPGKTNNGPLTIVANSNKYDINIPNGFDGAVGCTHTTGSATKITFTLK